MNEIHAVQTALAAEHAVIWGYAVVGVHVTAKQLPAVQRAELAHRSRRDLTGDLLRMRDTEPVEAQASYELPFPVTDPVTALRLAIHLEQGDATAWHFVLGWTDDVALRRTALTALTEAAVQATRWRLAAGTQPATVAFPGQ